MGRHTTVQLLYVFIHVMLQYLTILLSFHCIQCRENRYLLFLTENYAALEILRHYLNDVVQSSPVSSVATVAPANYDGSDKSLEKMEPFILFGSSFPRDKEYTQVCLGSSSLV